MTRVATWVLMAAVTAAVGCGDDTTAGTGGGGTGGGGTGGGGTGGGTGGESTTTTGSDTTTSSTGSPTTTTSSGGEGGGGGSGGEGGAGGGGQALCGNGVVEDGEACDDAGESADCDVDCSAATCGDSTLNESAGETCDTGGRSASCDADCTSTSCGDGVVNAAAGEACDDEGESATCDVDCSTVSCGDGVTNESAGETCDGMGETAACDDDCTAVACGDGIVNEAAGEGCDDGNAVDTDACLGTCEIATCGDGVVRAGVEECDDGGTAPGDGCAADCTFENAQCGEAYALLDTADRNVSFNDGGATVYCDEGGVSPGWVGPGWYRFTGGAGTVMPTVAPPPYSCATHAAGWLNGDHPSVDEGIVGRQVCWSWTPGPCWQTGNIEVVNCGDFYLYNLSVPLACEYRYCGTTCGDGAVSAGEQCDDGNTDAGDGCSPSCERELDPQCDQPVITLSAADRNVTSNDGNGGVEYCDDPSFAPSPDFQGSAWYRFSGAAGTQMPTTPPALYACGTDAPGWLNGVHPAIVEGVVDRQACFNWDGNTCNWNTAVQVVNCGDHYRYNLPYTGVCALRYCGTN